MDTAFSFKNIHVYLADVFHPYLGEALSKQGFHCRQGKPLYNGALDPQAFACDILIISTKSKITKEVIDALPNLKLIARGGSGLDNIDTAYAEQKGIALINTPEGNRDSVAEHALGMMLALLHNFRSNEAVMKGHWLPYNNRPFELRNKTVGIIGYGNTGAALANLLSVFGCVILVYDKYKTGYGTGSIIESTWDEIAEKADVLSLHVPLTDETRHLVDAAMLLRFKKKIILINTSRGEVVNTKDLLDALYSKEIAGLGLDVIEGESDYPKSTLYNFYQHILTPHLTFEKEVALPLIVTPHIAGKSYESQHRIALYLVDKIGAWCSVNLSN